MERDQFLDETPWQGIAGYSRACRVGQVIAVSGTTADLSHLDAESSGSTYAQAIDCLSRALAAVERLGGSIQGISRTRMFLAPHADPLEASRAHEEIFGRIAPANTTLFVHSLIGTELLIEVEIDAVMELGS